MSNEYIRNRFRREPSCSNDYPYYDQEPSQATMRSAESVAGHRNQRDSRGPVRAEAVPPVIIHNYYNSTFYVWGDVVQVNRLPDTNDFPRLRDSQRAPGFVEPRSSHLGFSDAFYQGHVSQNLPPDLNRRNDEYLSTRDIRRDLHHPHDEIFAQRPGDAMPRRPVRAHGYFEEFNEDDRGYDAHQRRPSFRYHEEIDPRYISNDRRYRNGAVGHREAPRARLPWQNTSMRSGNRELEAHRRPTTARRISDASSDSDVDRLPLRRNPIRRSADVRAMSHVRGRQSPPRTNVCPYIADLISDSSSESEIDSLPHRATTVQLDAGLYGENGSPEVQQSNETVDSAPTRNTVPVRTAEQIVLQSANDPSGQSEPETDLQEAPEANMPSEVEDRYYCETKPLRNIQQVGYEIANMSTRHKYDIRHKFFNTSESKCDTQIRERPYRFDERFYQFWYHFSRYEEIENPEDWCRRCLQQGKLTIGKRHKSDEHSLGMWYDHPSNPPLGRYASFYPAWPTHVFTHELPSVNKMVKTMCRRQSQIPVLPSINVSMPQKERVDSANTDSKEHTVPCSGINRNACGVIPRNAISHRFARHQRFEIELELLYMPRFRTVAPEPRLTICEKEESPDC